MPENFCVPNNNTPVVIKNTVLGSQSRIILMDPEPYPDEIPAPIQSAKINIFEKDINPTIFLPF
jgi:hypothetical protein